MAVAIQVYALTQSSFYVGLVGVFALVPLVVLGLYGGSIADAVDRRSLALVASAGLWSVSIALLVQAYVGNTSVWLLYGCIAVQSGFYAVNNPARSAMVPRLLDRELIPAAAALNMASFNLGLTLGPLLGALAVGWGGFPVAYGVDVVTFAAAYYALLRMPRMPPLHDSPKAGLKSVLDGLRFLKRSPNLRMTFIVDLCAMVLAQPRALFPALAYKVYGGGAGVVGLLQAAPAAGAIVAFLFSGWISQGAPAGTGDRDRGAGLRRRGRRGRAHRRAVDRRGVPGASPAWPTWSARPTATPSCRSPRRTTCAAGSRACSSSWSPAVRGPATSWRARSPAARGSRLALVLGGAACIVGVLTASALSRRFLEYDARHPTP